MNMMIMNIKNISKTTLIAIGIFSVAFSMYLITIPIYQIAYELNTLNKNILNINDTNGELKKLTKEFDKLNVKVDDSTILSF